MRLVVFGEALTYPPKEGISSHVFAMLHALAKSNIQPVLVAADRGFIGQNQFEQLPWQTYLLPPNDFYDYDTMRSLLDSLRPDAIQSYNVYQARLIAGRYSLERQVPLIMEHHDLEAELASFLGLPSHAAMANIQAQADMVLTASLNRVMSSRDYHALVSQFPRRGESIMHMPVGITDAFGDLPFEDRRPKNVLFIGNGAYPPNRQAIHYIVNKLADQLPDYTFHLAGRLTDQLASGGPPNVIGYGMVDDLSPLAAASVCGIVPIAAGSGMKIKMLSYMSAGLPIVGTPIALSGFSSQPFIIESSEQSFAAALRQLCSSPELPRLSADARQFYLENYESVRIGRKMVAAIEKLRFNPDKAAYRLQTIERDDTNLAWIHEVREKTHRPVSQPTLIAGRS